jgi:hypothetical protein
VPRHFNHVIALVSQRAGRIARLSLSVRLSRAGWYYMFVILCAFTGAVVRDSNPMLLLAGTLLGPLVLSFWFALRGLRRIELGRRLPISVCVGQPLIVELQPPPPVG